MTVSNSNGQWTARFLYVADGDADFSVTGFVPSRLPADAGGTFLVGGNGFDESTSVEVDGAPVMCTVLRAQVLECQVGPRPVGPVPVRVTSGDVWSDWPSGLTFYDSIEVYDIAPARGSIAGGAVVSTDGALTRPPDFPSKASRCGS